MTRCGDKVSDRGLATLARFTALEFLSLGATMITDECVESLLRLPALRELSFEDSYATRRTQLTENGCAALKTALPNCAFRWPEAGPGRRPAVALFER